MNNLQLKEVIKQSIREVLGEERLSLCEALIPYVSQKEMNEIIKKFGSAPKYKNSDFVDMTDWIKK